MPEGRKQRFQSRGHGNCGCIDDRFDRRTNDSRGGGIDDGPVCLPGFITKASPDSDPIDSSIQKK